MKTRLNLLPWKCRRARLVRRRALQWAIVGSALIGASLAVVYVRGGERAAAERQVGDLEEEYAPVAALRREIRELQTRRDEATRRLELVERLRDDRPALTLVGMVSQSAAACDGKLRVESLSVRPHDAAGREKGQAASTSTVSVKGTALDNLAVARFVLALRQTGAFDRVELKSSAEQAAGELKLCSYQVECAY